MALSGNTVFITYLLYPSEGNSPYIHCNYIHTLQVSDADISATKINISFPELSHFKFLSENITTGTGFTATQIFALIQIVPNSGFTTINNVKPTSSLWKYYSLTNQIVGVGTYITPLDLISTVFTIPLSAYGAMSSWDVKNILSYMTALEATGSKLSFGDEYFFFGNVSSQIKATAYTMELPVALSPQEFNTSTNATWNSSLDSSVVISEVAIYDQNKNLVAIGKLNDPIQKNLNSEGTILFAIDF